MSYTTRVHSENKNNNNIIIIEVSILVATTLYMRGNILVVHVATCPQ